MLMLSVENNSKDRNKETGGNAACQRTTRAHGSTSNRLTETHMSPAKEIPMKTILAVAQPADH